MRIKNDSVKIDQLHRRLKKTIPLLDVLHKEITNGKELVITSGKDGVHSAGSFHYVGKAYDFRRWAYDKLNQHKKELFLSCLETIFPDKYFDLVLETDHFHVEFDPKPIKEVTPIRIKATDFEPILDEKQPTKLPNREVKVGLLEQIDRKNLLKGTLNGVFRYFTKFNLFLRVKSGASDDQSLFGRLIELINILITKLKGKSS